MFGKNRPSTTGAAAAAAPAKQPSQVLGLSGDGSQKPSPATAAEAPPSNAPAVQAAQTLLSQLQIADARPAIEAIEHARGSKLMCLTYNDLPPTLGLTPGVIPTVEAALSNIGKVPKLDLLLRTQGGISETSWRIVCLLREFTEELGVIVSHFALSAGTHVALAADDLVMGPFATLSSVDPTRLHALLPRDTVTNKPIPASVQDLKQCVQFIREQLGEAYSQQNLALIISELFRYVNPLALGALEQSYNLAKLITRKVLNARKSKLPEEQVEKIVELLSGKFFSHSLQLSRTEVETELGLAVTRPDDSLEALITEFEGLYLKESLKILPAPANPKEQLLRVGALLQTAGSGWAIAHSFKLDGTHVSDPWVKFR